MKRCLIHFTLIGLLCLTISACDKEQLTEDDDVYSISLIAEIIDNQVVLDWTATPISNFEGYVIFRSRDSIPDKETLAEYEGLVWDQITAIDSTRWVDLQPEATESLYYKVVVKFADRLILSPTVRLDFEVTYLDMVYDKVYNIQNSNLLIGYDAYQKTFQTYDYVNNEVLHTGSLYGDFRKISTAHYQNKPVIVAVYSDIVRFFDVVDLDFVASFQIGEEVRSIDIDDDFIYIVVRNSGYPSLEIRSIHDFSMLKRHIIYDAWQTKVTVYNNQNEILLTNNDKLWHLQISPTGEIETIEEKEVDLDGTLFDHAALSPDRQYFVINNYGGVFDLSFNKLGSVETPSNFPPVFVGENADILFL